MINTQLYDGLFNQLNSDVTVLTPNRRLSATLHKLYHQYKVEQQHACWATPDIVPISTWIQRLWSDYADSTLTHKPLILNTAQEHYLWEGILASSKTGNELLQVSETAEIVKSAWGLLKQWQIDLGNPSYHNTSEYSALLAWTSAFQNISETSNLIDIASLPDLIIEKIKSKDIKPNKNIILIGFTELSPLIKNLLSFFRVTEANLASATYPQRIKLKDNEDEILTMARWAKSTFDAHPSLRIGCVIPSLDKMRNRVAQLFEDVFGDSNFNISAGKPLSHYPIIFTALNILSLHKRAIKLDSISSILTSPFIGNAESEHIRRAGLDSELRRENVAIVHLPSEDIEKACPRLSKKIAAFLAKLDESPKKHTFADLSTLFNELLMIIGWPGERSLNSEEYQIVEQWLRLLDDFSTLDAVAEPITIQQALHSLQKLTSNTIFQPKSPDASVQILGLLEAAGTPFDYLWIMGMDDVSWPPQPKPNPLIPKQWQRELHMPHSTAQRELIYCQKLTDQFKSAAKDVVFSYAEHVDEIELNVSPLIRDLSEITIENLHLQPYQSPASQIFQAQHMESFIDNLAPALQSDEKIRGGISVLKQQALCPFKSFAEWRLHAHELETPLYGFRAKDRGNLLHTALEIIWNDLQDHHNLCQLNDADLLNRINLSIDESLAKHSKSHRDKKQYLSLEKQRLSKLLWDWLQIEKKRPSFRIYKSEKSAQMVIGNLNLTVRIDRIDELPDGTKLIIDYKSSKNNNINNWFGDRPEEPQLPLYALLDIENTSGITFAQIAPGDLCFKGISRYPIEIDGILEASTSKKCNNISWDNLTASWKTSLTQLSNDFVDGKADVDPKDPPTTCEWCNLKPLCRIQDDINARHETEHAT